MSFTRGPLDRLAPGRLRRVLEISGLLAAVLFAALIVIDTRITGTGGPGILALEVAGSAGRASVILGEWGPEGIDWARISLLVDFPFLVAYAVFFSAVCTRLAEPLRRRAEAQSLPGGLAATLARFAPWVGWSFVLAAVLDLIENLALLRVIDYDLTPWALVAQLAAAPKLAILGAGLAFVVLAVALTARQGKQGEG